MHLFKSRIWLNYIVYAIPLTFTWYLAKLVFYIAEPKYTIDDIFNIYLIFVGFVSLCIIVGATYVALQIKKPFILRLILTLIFGILFIPTFILFIFGGLFIAIFPRLSCPVTYFINILTQFMTGMFIIKRGNLKSLTKGKAVIVLNHRSSGDYSLAATVAGSNHWRVMVGANLWKHSWIRWFLNRVGLKIMREKDRAEDRAAAVRQANAFIDTHKNAKVIFFSEGTRNRDDNVPLLPFYPGAFKLACEKQIPIIPVVIVGMQHWRRPSPQDITSYEKNKKLSFLRLIKYAPKNIIKLLITIFREGINPTIIKAYYLDPVKTVGKEPGEIGVEVWGKMNEFYILKSEEIKE